MSGNGSYIRWLNSMKYAIDKYRPYLKGIDSTGTQKAIDELVFEREGIPVASVNFARDKDGMLNALKLLFQNHELRYPYIKGMRHQLRSHKTPDKDLTQDIVAAMMVFAFLARFLPNSLPSQKPVKVQTAASVARALRSQRLDRRRQ